MEDEWQFELARDADLAAKHPCGDFARRVIIVVVEPGLSDADAFGMRSEPAHGGKILRRFARRLMRMRADGEEDTVVPFGDFDYARRPGDARADRDHPLDAARVSARDDGVEVVGEVGKVEVAVTVD